MLSGFIELSYSQGSGIGYQLDLGGSWYNQECPDYRQSIRTITHNGFIRFHNQSGNNAVKLMIGYRTDTIPFKNYSSFLVPDNLSMMHYSTNAYIKRNAWRFAAINQFQFGQKPGRFLFSVNTGLFYERNIRARRSSIDDDYVYVLHEEIIKNNLGVIAGGELRIFWFTVGIKYEKLIRDILNHDFILSQELNTTNSTELRGLKLNPGMFFIHLGVNIDFFD